MRCTFGLGSCKLGRVMTASLVKQRTLDSWAYIWCQMRYLCNGEAEGSKDLWEIEGNICLCLFVNATWICSWDGAGDGSVVCTCGRTFWLFIEEWLWIKERWCCRRLCCSMSETWKKKEVHCCSLYF